MKKILIIEDDAVVANIYGNKFSLSGFAVKIAADGELGLQLLKTFQPDLVHLDLQVPKVNGVEIIKRIRANPELHTLPIIVLSNAYVTSWVTEAWQAGADKCVTKGNCTPRAMLEMVNEIFAASSSAPAAAPAVPRPPSQLLAEVDTTFEAEIRRAFLERAPQMLTALRSRFHALSQKDSHSQQTPELSELCRTVHALTGNAGIAGFSRIVQMSSALEALLKELHEKPKYLTASTLRTVARTLDFLGVLLEQAAGSDAESAAPALILVVDDEIISRQAVASALAKANLISLCVEDPLVALKLLPENHFSLIFLDVEMPGLNGFELCNRLRALPAHKTTPVVFVTSLNDFESRGRSVLSGGNDLIAKPFLLMELAVKALSYVLKAPPHG